MKQRRNTYTHEDVKMEKGPAEPFFSFWAGLEGLLLRLRPGTHQVSKALIRFSARSITVVSTDGTDSTDVMYRPHVQMVVDGPGAGDTHTHTHKMTRYGRIYIQLASVAWANRLVLFQFVDFLLLCLKRRTPAKSPPYRCYK